MEHIPLLRSLWKEAFGDTEEFLDGFFSTAYAPRRCLTLWKENSLAAALYWFDCSCREDRCAYIYAVATAKAFRGQGLCHALMEHTHRHLSGLGYAMTVLVPGSHALFRFYASMGYACFGGIREAFHTAGETAVSLRQLTPEQYAQARRGKLPQGSVLQEGENLAFLQTQADFYAGEDILLCARRENGTLFAQELLGSGDPGSILKGLSCREGTFRTPGAAPFAMYKPLTSCEKPEYFSFAFD